MPLRLLIFFLLTAPFAWAQPVINPLPTANLPKPVVLAAQYLIDTSDRLTIQTVTATQTGWQTPATSLLMPGFTPHPVWCRFTIGRPITQPAAYALELSNYYPDSVTLYQPRPTGGWATQYTGDLIPFALHNPQTRYPTFYINLPDAAPQTVYVKVLSTLHHSYQFRVWDRGVFVAQRLFDKEIYMAFGLIVMQALFNLALLLFMFRDGVLRSYALFGLATNFLIIGNANNISFFSNNPYWVNTLQYVGVGLLLTALCYYVVQALRLRAFSERLTAVYTFFGGMGLFYALLSFWIKHPYITQVFVGSLSIVMFLTIILIPFLYWRGIRPRVLNVLVFIVVFPPYAYLYGRNAGFLPGAIQEETFSLFYGLAFLTEPFFIAGMLWKTTRAHIAAQISLSHEQTQHETAQISLRYEQAQRENMLALDQLKTNFFTSISHEFRTPLTLLLGPLQDFSTRFPTDALYASMHRNAQRLLTLINQLLDLAKLDAGQLPINRQPGNLVADMRIWVAGFESLAQSRGITLSLNQNQPQWSAEFDADKLEKITSNLLSNALKFSNQGDSVTVRATYDPAGVSIQVSDTGVGISPASLPRIFDRFYQAEVTTNSANAGAADGTGVGLALVNELVNLLGGTISADSQPGVGSTFTVWLPIRSVAVDDTKRRQTATIEPQVTTGKPAVNRLIAGATPEADDDPAKPLLLLIEDNDDLRGYLRLMLAPHYRVLEASDGQQGLEQAFETIPDLIVTDLMMPRLNGLDLCRALRADVRTNHIPVVMLTAKAAIQNRLEGFETGADDYLTKPFVAPELLARLQNLLRRQTAVRAYYQRQLLAPSQPVPQPDALAEPQNGFMEGLVTLLDTYLDVADFDVEALARYTAMSSRTLNRKLQAVAGISARDLIRNHRLRRGADLIQTGLSPSETAYRVGFGSPSAFSRAFKEQYGYPPSAAVPKP